MKLSKREKSLLFILFGAVFIWGYYFFLITPQLARIETTKNKVELAEQKLAEYEMATQIEAQLDNTIAELDQKVVITANNYFPSIQQEELILLMQDFLNDSNLRVSTFAFTPPNKVTLGEASLDNMGLNISYEGNFQELNGLLKKMWDFQKTIILNNVNISSRDDGSLSGTIGIDFYHLPDAVVAGGLYDWYLQQINKKNDPFRMNSSLSSPKYIYRAGNSLLLIDRRYRKFNDIVGHWAENEIDSFGARYFIRGDRNNYYFPDESMSRGEFVLLLDMLHSWEDPTQDIDLTQFEDYESLGNYEDAIARAIYKGVYSGFILGFGDNTLRPQAPITYREVEHVMTRLLNNDSFQWQEIGNEILSERGFRSRGLDDLNRNITRAEIIYLLYNL